MSDSQTIDKNTLIKWAVVFIAAAAIWFIPCNEIYSPEVKKFLFVTALGILLVAFELIDLMAVSMMFPIGYILFGLAPMDSAYGAWLGTTPMVVIGGYMIANVMDRIGLLKRIAYKCILLVGGSYYGLLYGVLIAGCIFEHPPPAATHGLSWRPSPSACAKPLTWVKPWTRPSSCSWALYRPARPAYSFIRRTSCPSYLTRPKLAGASYAPTWIQYFTQMAPYVLFILVLVFLLPKIYKPTKKKIAGQRILPG